MAKGKPVQPDIASLLRRATSEGDVINVRVEPRSGRSGISGVMDNGTLKVKLNSPPVDGEANKELIATLAEAFGKRKSDIRILRGETSKTKAVLVAGGIGRREK